MGFTNSMLSAFKKLGCISEPRVEETFSLPQELPEDLEAADGRHKTKESEEQINKENLKEKIMEVQSEEEEQPKIDLASAVPLQTIEEEQEELQRKTSEEEETAATTMAETKCQNQYDEKVEPAAAS